MQFQNCTKTGLTPSTQNFVYSKRHCLRFVLESILRNHSDQTFWKRELKSQLRACVENAGARFGPESVIASLALSASHEMTWDPTFDKSGSHLITCVVRCLLDAKAWVLSAVSQSTPLPPLTSPPKHPFSMMLSQNLIFVIVFTVHFHVTTWVQRETGRGGRGVYSGEPPKPFGRSAFSYWSLQTLPTLLPSSAETFAVQPIQEPKYFPPNCLLPCSCWRMRARAQYVPMKRQNLSKTLKVAKKSISSHKLFIIIVTSTIHYATENNCKEISQDRNLVRMHHHHHVWKTAKLNDLSNCLFFILQAKMRSTM